MSDANKNVARRVVEEMLSGRPEVAGELFTPSQVAKQAQLAQMLLASFPDLQVRADDIIAEGDKVVTRWTARGTQRGPFLRIPPTNATVSWTGMTLDRFEDGKIAESKTNWDTFDLVQQLSAAAKGS